MALQDLTPQLRTRLRRVEKVVGLFVVLALLVLLAGFAYYLYHMSQRKGWFIPKSPYFTFAQSAEGLKIGDPIVLMGFEVGNITTITAQSPAEHRVFVGMEVRQPYYGYIWSDSKVKIAAAGLLGGRGLEITAGEAGMPTVKEEGGKITALWIHDEWKPIEKVRKGVRLDPIEDPPLSDRAAKLVSIVEGALPNILGLTNQLYNILTNTAELTANANQMVTNLTAVTANLRDPHGSLGEWLIPADLHTNIDTNLVAIAGSLNTTILNLAAITSNLNAQVETNDKMLTRISSLVIDTDNLVQGLKKHWLLRGVFQKMNTQTNAPAATAPPTRPAEQGK